MDWLSHGTFKHKFQGQTMTLSLQTDEKVRLEQEQGDPELAIQGSL